MPTVYMMIGLPGVGKSTWIDKKIEGKNNFAIVSTDDFISELGKLYGMTYNEMYDDITYSFAEKMMYKIAKKMIDEKKDIYWDQTNLTVKTRKRKLGLFPKDYKRVYVVFDIPEDHDKRLDRPGKIIPKHVLESMKNKYQEPSSNEGYDEIIYLNK